MAPKNLLFIIFLSMMAPPCFAGDISGFVKIDFLTPDPQSPISPFARSRSGVHPRVPSDEVMQSVVYLSASRSLPIGSPPDIMPIVDQRNLTIIPHILPILVGTVVEFPNSDALYHNLFSLSPARKFDLGRYAKGKSKTVTFDKVGEVHIFCDIHPSMSGVVLVLPNQYFTTTDREGHFQIKDVPAGTYEINAWHEQLADVKETVVVPTSGNVEVILNLSEK